MASIAEPLPIQVIAELIGVPEERWGWVTETSKILRRVVDPFVTLDPAEVDRTCDELATYYGDLADERAAHPTDDLLSELARAEVEGQIDRNELLSLLVILLFAGHETTTGAIGNAVVALGRNPDQRDLLLDQPDLWPNAIEELLRYDTAIQTDPRDALEDVTIGAGRSRPARTSPSCSAPPTATLAASIAPTGSGSTERTPHRSRSGTGSTTASALPSHGSSYGRPPRHRRRARALHDRRDRPRVEDLARVPQPSPPTRPATLR